MGGTLLSVAVSPAPTLLFRHPRESGNPVVLVELPGLACRGRPGAGAQAKQCPLQMHAITAILRIVSPT